MSRFAVIIRGSRGSLKIAAASSLTAADRIEIHERKQGGDCSIVDLHSDRFITAREMSEARASSTKEARP